MFGFIDKTLLFPYYAILRLRHCLYDKKILRSAAFPGANVIGIGNITAGGTGKTPHVEMLVRLLGPQQPVAVLSRGYRRKTKGFRIAGPEDTFRTIGDEPMQIHRKFPEITVAVCRDRAEGVRRLLSLPEAQRPRTILLDDSFQHRRIVPRRQIVLVRYDKPVFSDHLLPVGSLRDLPRQIRRADAVIVTKCPLWGWTDGMLDEQAAAAIVETETLRWRRQLRLDESQQLYFSAIRYGEPLPVFPEAADHRYVYSGQAVFFTGIADDREFRSHLLGRYRILDSLAFPDHRKFSSADLRHIARRAARHPMAVVYTTEKDAVRLLRSPLPEDLRKRLFYIPIEVNLIPSSRQQDLLGSLL